MVGDVAEGIALCGTAVLTISLNAGESED